VYPKGGPPYVDAGPEVTGVLSALGAVAGFWGVRERLVDFEPHGTAETASVYHRWDSSGYRQTVIRLARLAFLPTRKDRLRIFEANRRRRVLVHDPKDVPAFAKNPCDSVLH